MCIMCSLLKTGQLTNAFIQVQLSHKKELEQFTDASFKAGTYVHYTKYNPSIVTDPSGTSIHHTKDYQGSLQTLSLKQVMIWQNVDKGMLEKKRARQIKNCMFSQRNTRICRLRSNVLHTTQYSLYYTVYMQIQSSCPTILLA